MDLDRLSEICRALPVFPLPRTVLLPGSLLPLHVFEPRYRALVEHCMAGDRVLGVATLKPGFEEDYAGTPPFWPEIGVGHLVAHQPLPDGRSNIVLEYVGRVHVARELESPGLFRQVEGVIEPEDATGLAGALRGLKWLVLQLGSIGPDAAEEAQRLVELEGMDLVDALARRVLDDVDDQRSYLRTCRLVERIELVQERLARFLLPTRSAGDA